MVVALYTGLQPPISASKNDRKYGFSPHIFETRNEIYRSELPQLHNLRASFQLELTKLHHWFGWNGTILDPLGFVSSLENDR